MYLLNQAHKIREELIENRRWLHQHPGIGFDLPKTKEYVRGKLEAMGLSPKDCGKCGLVADITAGPGKMILLRADMDGLPIAEEAALPFSSQNGYMHACGHDLHTAMLLGAAKLLMENRSKLQGTVRLVFQSAEEILEGAEDMIHGGILNGVDAAVMIHVTVATSVPTGTIIVAPPGVSAPAAAYFSIKVQGAGCHGAAPYKGVDALTAAAHILIALQEIHAREMPSDSGAVLTIGTFSGGTADNAIADRAQLEGTLRAFDDRTVLFLKTRLTEISRSIASAFRATAEVTFSRSCPTLVNDADLCRIFHDALMKHMGENSAINAASLARGSGGGSEDFAYISQKVPSVMLALAAGQPEYGYRYPLHHPKVTFDENSLPFGAAALACCALSYLSE